MATAIAVPSALARGDARPKNPPGLEKALIGLWMALDGLDELREYIHTNDAGRRGLLYDVKGIRYSLAWHQGILDGHALPFPESIEHLRQEALADNCLDVAEVCEALKLFIAEDSDAPCVVE